MGGGVAPSASSEPPEPALVGDDCVVSASSCVAAVVPGLESTWSGAGVAEDSAGAGDSLSSSFNGADDRAG